MASYLSVLIQAAEPANYKLNYDEHYMISVPFATTTTPGIASFNGDYFKVVNGVVSLSDEYAGELGNIVDRLDDIDDRLDGVDDDITDLDNGKVDKVTPTEVGLYAYVVQKNSSNGVNNYILDIAPYNVVVPGAIVRYSLTGTLKTGSAETPLDAVNLLDLENATTNIPESALSSDVRVKLNKMISRVGISPADWEALPVADRDINTWYFVGPYGTAPNQYFVEYVYFVKNDIGIWEPLGSTLAVDLSGYFTKSEINALLAGKANTDGVYSGMSVGHANIADQINTDREIENADTACPPVVFGTVGGAAEVQNGLMPFPEVHGYTIKWNQLADCANNTTDHESNVISSKLFNYHFSHKYLAIFDYEIESSVGNIYFLFGVWNSSQTSYRRQRINATGLKGRAAVIVNFDNISANDLTDGEKAKVLLQRLGTDISASNKVSTSNIQFFDLTDNIYGAGNEPTSADVFVRSFPMPYYPYNAGTPLSSKSSSVDFVKRNQWDEEWEVGSIDATTGANDNNVSSLIRSKNYTMVIPGEVYYASLDGYNARIFFYDANKNFLSYYDRSGDGTFTVPINACFIRFRMNTAYGTTYNHDICIYINWDTPGLPYVPYSKQHITLPNLELRSAGSAYDVLYQQGGGKRRAGTYTFDGTEMWLQGSSQTSAGMYRYYLNKNIGMKVGLAQDGLCNAFENLGANWNQSTQEGVFFGISNELVQFVTATAKTTAELQAIFNSSVTIVFPLATETDITIEENPGWTEYAEIDNFGTVKFSQDPAQDIPVPQAYFVRYTVNLVEFLDSLYVHCGGDVSKIALVSL